MSDEDVQNEDEANPDDGEGGKKKKRLSGKKIVLLGFLPLLLISGGGAGVMFSGVLDSEEVEVVEEEVVEEGPENRLNVVFYDLPEMLVNLNSDGRQSSFLKIQVSLELDSPEAVPTIEAVLPRIVDNFQVYLRELRPDELSGTKGMVRLKEELLVRVNGAVEPTKVYDILFKEILVQG
jgi:flagellar FliL protein